MRVARQATIPSNSEGVALVKTEATGLVQVDALPDYDFMRE